MARASIAVIAGLLIVLSSLPAAATWDLDNDGVYDPLDNCSQTKNPTNRDTDQDGYGDMCDADFDNDFVCLPFDLNIWLDIYESGTNAATGDVDGNGSVNAHDLEDVIWDLFIGTTPCPGPSGLSCAGTIPCSL